MDTTNTRNGLNLEQMQQTVMALQDDPQLALFKFRTSNQWISGGENRSSIQGFYGAGVEDSSRTKAFEFTNGEPPVLLGNNEGANPVEYLLHALAGCITTTTVLHASARGITIHSISTELSGDIDVQGLLDLDADVAVGYQGITVNMRIEADCSDGELDELLAFSKAHSPMCSTVCRPVPVTLNRITAQQRVA
ncbi:MAG: OsmC family protein [Halioglobus sp.]